MIKRFVILTTFFFLFSSCSIAKFAKYYAGAESSGDSSPGSLKGLYYEGDDTSYIIGRLPDTWKRIEIKGGDLAFLKPQDNSTITVNSTCDKNKIKYSLRALSNTLLIGIDDKKLIESSERKVSGEISLQRIYEGNVSGVPIKISTVVLKKGDCIYDMSYSSTRDNFDNWFGEFNEFVSRFKIMS
jgi:hypothetical protein